MVRVGGVGVGGMGMEVVWVGGVGNEVVRAAAAAVVAAWEGAWVGIQSTRLVRWR